MKGSEEDATPPTLIGLLCLLGHVLLASPKVQSGTTTVEWPTLGNANIGAIPIPWRIVVPMQNSYTYAQVDNYVHLGRARGLQRLLGLGPPLSQPQADGGLRPHQEPPAAQSVHPQQQPAWLRAQCGPLGDPSWCSAQCSLEQVQ